MRSIISLILCALLLNGCGTKNLLDTQHTSVHEPASTEEPQDDFGKALKARNDIDVDDISKYFVDEKNINKRDAGTKDTPLLAAARYNNLPVVKFLLQKGAQPNDVYQNQSKTRYPNGYPALWSAVSWNNAEMVKALLDAGADPRLGTQSGFGPIIHWFSEMGGRNDALEQLLKADKTLANWKIWTGTPLHRATNSQHIDTIKLLLRYGADKTLTDREGHRPWYWADAQTRKAVPELEP